MTCSLTAEYWAVLPLLRLDFDSGKHGSGMNHEWLHEARGASPQLRLVQHAHGLSFWACFGGAAEC